MIFLYISDVSRSIGLLEIYDSRSRLFSPPLSDFSTVINLRRNLESEIAITFHCKLQVKQLSDINRIFESGVAQILAW